MYDKKLLKIIEQNSMNFKLLISNKEFNIDQIRAYQNDNPIDKPTTRGGVYFADTEEMKIEATLVDTSITKYLSNAMLGPNKTFLDILIESQTKDEKKISFITNLTNTIQKSSKIILYLTVKDIIIKSD